MTQRATRNEARAILDRHKDALNRHDAAALDALYTEDAVLDSPMFATVRGREAIRRSYERLFVIFPDYTIEMNDALFFAEGGRAAKFGVVSGTHAVDLFGLPPTGQRIHYHAARLFTIRDGLIAYEQRIYDYRGVLDRLEKVRLDRELSMASVVQHALCRTRHDGSFFEAVGASLPCRAIGGDFLEYLDLPHGRLGVAVGDVSGKGPAAALVAAMLQGMFSMVAVDVDSPSAALARLNTAVCGRALEPRFATLTFCALAPDGRLTYSNAGHNPPLVVGADGIRHLTAGGPMLGVFGEARFPEATVSLAPSDTLIVFSDGVTDAVAPDGRDFGMERLLAVAAAHRGADPRTIRDALLDTVRQFCGDAPPNDDVTIGVVRFLGVAGGT